MIISNRYQENHNLYMTTRSTPRIPNDEYQHPQKIRNRREVDRRRACPRPIHIDVRYCTSTVKPHFYLRFLSLVGFEKPDWFWVGKGFLYLVVDVCYPRCTRHERATKALELQNCVNFVLNGLYSPIHPLPDLAEDLKLHTQRVLTWKYGSLTTFLDQLRLCNTRFINPHHCCDYHSQTKETRPRLHYTT